MHGIKSERKIISVLAGDLTGGNNGKPVEYVKKTKSVI